MAGDVNVFFRDDIGREAFSRSRVTRVWRAVPCADGAEIEVMVAEEASRRKGIAREAVELMMQYVIESYPVTRFVAKILGAHCCSALPTVAHTALVFR